MNYCILNGKKSTLIKGLLIQSLPIITKPMMRTNIETVDGRDGDIVTKLGYAAYDKTMSIGLFGDYDIDEVIEYFSTEGTVIFSNEPDKYYKYQILNQIDFTRLSRFKTATVTFHVQPFKYSAVEEKFIRDDVLSTPEFSVVNRGNVYSRPTIKATGDGEVRVWINGVMIFNHIYMDAASGHDYIVLDGVTWEAYDDTGIVTYNTGGSFKDMVLQPGENTIKFDSTGSGYVEQVEMENISRWI